MSLNLHCNLIELNQAPQLVSQMCMVQPDGSIPAMLKGKKAVHALQIYILWCKFRQQETDEESKQVWGGHLQRVLKVLKKKNLVIEIF
jgi:hypothetical protein